MTQRQVATSVLIVAALMDMIDVTVVNVALPTIRAGLGASSTELEWVVSAYMLAFAAFLIPSGSLGDAFGRRRVFAIGVGVFGAASLAAGLAQSPGALIACRFVQGAAAAAMTPQILATFRSMYTGEARGKVFAVYGAVLGLAAGIGLIIGGALTEANLFGWHWRSVFFVNVPIAILVLVATLRFVPETYHPAPRRPDALGAAMLALTVAAVAYPLLEGRRLGWPAWAFAVLAAGISVLLLLVWREARRDEDVDARAPLIRPRLLAIPAFSIGLAVQFAFSAALQGFSVIFTVWLQLGQGFSPLRAGLTMVAFSVGSLFVAPFSVEAAHKWGHRALSLGGLLLAAGVIAVEVGARHVRGTGPWPLTPGLVIAGAGLALLVIPLVNVVLAAVPGRAAGGASGLFSTAQQLGGAVGVAVLGTIFFSSSTRPLRVSFTHTVPYVAAIYGLAALLALFLPSHGVSEEEALEAGGM